MYYCFLGASETAPLFFYGDFPAFARADVQGNNAMVIGVGNKKLIIARGNSSRLEKIWLVRRAKAGAAVAGKGSAFAGFWI